MQIEEQIKKLLRIKAKIDLYRDLPLKLFGESAKLAFEPLEKDHPGLLAEFQAEVESVCNKRIEMLNANTGLMPKPIEPLQVELKTETPKATSEDPNEEPKDPLKFLLKYKFLDNKDVVFMSKDGTNTEIHGKVKGLMTPNCIVVTDQGYNLKVNPKDLRVVE